MEIKPEEEEEKVEGKKRRNIFVWSDNIASDLFGIPFAIIGFWSNFLACPKEDVICKHTVFHSIANSHQTVENKHKN